MTGIIPVRGEMRRIAVPTVLGLQVASKWGGFYGSPAAMLQVRVSEAGSV